MKRLQITLSDFQVDSLLVTPHHFLNKLSIYKKNYDGLNVIITLLSNELDCQRM